MLSGRTAAFATLWVSLSLATPGALGAQAEMDANPRQPRFLLAVAGTWKPIDVQRTPALSRHIALDFNGETLAEALAVITRRSGLRLAYTEDVLPRHARVQLRASEISVAGALSTVLLDAGVDVVFTSGSRASLVRRVAVAPPPVGSVVGRVTDAETGEGIGDVEVLLERTRWRTLTAADGQYRLAEVDTGSHVVTARRIGYTKQSRSVVVVEAQEVRADFALERSAQQLDEVVTTGTVVPTEVRALPSPVTVISERDIELQRPRDVQEVFRQAVPSGLSWDPPNTPHVTFFSTRGASSLGASGGQMKVFVDGIPVANPTFAAADPSSIDRIEVVRGPQAAALYGSDAIGGVIQIFTKRGDPSLTRPQVNAEASLGVVQTPYADHRTVLRQEYKASARGGGSDISYGLGGGYSHTGDYAPNGDVSRQYAPSAYGGMNYTRGIITLDLSARYYVENVANVFNPDLINTGLASFSRPNYQPIRAENQTVGGRLTVSPTRWWQHTLTIGLDRYDQEQVQTQARLVSPGDTLLFAADYSYLKRSIGYNTSFAGEIGSGVSGSLTTGFDHYSNPVTQWYTFGAVNTTGTIVNAPGYSFTTSRTRTNNTGYFAQTQVGFRNAVFLTAGLRAEENSGFGDSLGTQLAPRVGLAYVRPIGSTIVKVRGAWGRAIRAPDPTYKTSVVTPSSITLANPSLGPERQHGWDAGVDMFFGSRGSLSATYYHQIASQLIDYVPVDPSASPPTNQFQNVGRVKNSGVEIEGTLNAGPLQLKGQYAYTRARIEQLAANYTGDLQQGDRPFLTPKHTAGATLSLQARPGTSLAAGLTYAGSFNLYDFIALFSCFGGTGPCQPGPGLRGYITSYPGFVKINASIGQQLTSIISAFVAVNNLTNNEAVEYFNTAPVRGRTTTVGVRFRY